MDWIKDAVQAGLYKRIRETGDVWTVKSRIKGGKPITHTIGKVSLFKPTAARAEARRVLALLAQGINPSEERKQQALTARARSLTLATAIEQYSSLVTWKPKTRLDVLATFKRRFSDWYALPLASITKEQCQTRFLKIKADVATARSRIDATRASANLPVRTYRNEVGAGEAQRAFRYLSALFNNYCLDEVGDEKLLPKGNPCLILKAKRLRRVLIPRERFLDKEQRVRLYEALSLVGHSEYRGRINENARDLVWLLVHTGLRLDEARCMLWDAVDFSKEIFMAEDTKNYRIHTLPMTEATKSMFKRRFDARGSNVFVFQSPVGVQPLTASRYFERVSKEIGFEFSAHDLRRTVATVASELGYDLNTIGAVLNHSSGGVTSGYVQHTYTRLKGILEDIQNTLFAEPYEAEALAQ